MARLIDADALIIRLREESVIPFSKKLLTDEHRWFLKLEDMIKIQPTANIDKDVRVEAYNKGLNDVWELMKKLALDIDDGGLSHIDICSIYGMPACQILQNMTPQEALAKLEAYEKEQAEIKVGDVVISDAGHKALVVGVDKGNKDGIFVMWDDGVTGLRVKQSYTKTGKHIDIQSVLQQIAE